eukprot:TRINITY_DN21907_c0_g1_i1.p1 TRINITY_DN21907_c0_g1~~TRINITY_DN21907_c0_g1_i1.p1  ORF type:complete len:405 (-),score=34.13 TRINITY_DN21907_c0_g1_i1:33-1094(-)
MIFKHPLQLFIRGEFDKQLGAFPPSYWLKDGSLMSRLSESLGMTRQIASVQDEDKDWEEFIINEMFLSDFFFCPCKNKKVKDLGEKILDMTHKLNNDLFYQVRDRHKLSVTEMKKLLSPVAFVKWVTRTKTSSLDQALVILREDRKLRIMAFDLGLLNLADLQPDEITQDLCEEAVKRGLGDSLGSIPIQMRTEKLVRIALARYGGNLMHVPDSIITEELCKIAIRSTPIALIYLPEKFKTRELYELAVKLDHHCFRYVPKHLLTYEICDLVITQSSLALRDVPVDMLTPELCKKALQRSPHIISILPTDMRTKELCEIVVKLSGYELRNVPFHLRTEEMTKLALNLDYCEVD